MLAYRCFFPTHSSQSGKVAQARRLMFVARLINFWRVVHDMFQPGKLLNYITQIIILKHFLIVEICNSDVSMCPSARGRGLVVRRIVKVLEWKTQTNSCLWNMCGTRDKTKLTHCARATYYHIYPHLVLTSQCLSVSVMKPLQHLGISCIEHWFVWCSWTEALGCCLGFPTMERFRGKLATLSLMLIISDSPSTPGCATGNIGSIME